MAKLSSVILILLAPVGLAAHTHPVSRPYLLHPQDCFEAQVEELVSRVTAPEELMRNLSLVQQTVELTLNTVWPGSRVKLFGSFSTGLGAASSDVDLTVFLPDHHRRDVIDTAYTAFQSSPDTYQHINTRARLPALTFKFQPFGIKCDVNFKNEGTYESELLQHLLSLDDRAFKLAVIIKYWAKVQGVIRAKYLTSYCMMIMVVFYLQQISVLPSVEKLQNGCPALLLNSTNNFNVAFDRNYTVSKRNESLYDVLRGFFEFYERFDFDDSVICPFTGRVARKMSFKSLASVPEEFSQYKMNVQNNIIQPMNITPVCVQSLLILNDNCAWRVDDVRSFVDNFRSVSQTFKHVKKCQLLKAIGVDLNKHLSIIVQSAKKYR